MNQGKADNPQKKITAGTFRRKLYGEINNFFSASPNSYGLVKNSKSDDFVKSSRGKEREK